MHENVSAADLGRIENLREILKDTQLPLKQEYKCVVFDDGTSARLLVVSRTLGRLISPVLQLPPLP